MEQEEQEHRQRPGKRPRQHLSPIEEGKRPRCSTSGGWFRCEAAEGEMLANTSSENEVILFAIFFLTTIRIQKSFLCLIY